MKITYCIKLFLALGFFISQDLSATISDSININSSYDKIQKLFYNNETKDSVLAKYYAELYLNKAKRDYNKINMAKGYLFMSYINNNTKGLKYTDSAILLTKDSDDDYLPTSGYLTKAYIYGKLGEHDKSLNNYLLAYPYAKKKNNINHLFNINLNLATIKAEWGAYEEALKIYKRQIDLFKNIKNFKEKYLYEYLVLIYNTSVLYTDLREIDSADYYLKEGLDLISQTNYKSYDKNKFKFVEYTNYYYKSKFSECIDSVQSVLPHFQDDFRTNMLGNIYIGKSYISKMDFKNGIKYLIKADSIYVQNDEQGSIKELRDSYLLLVGYYKKNNNLKEQLVYLNKLISFDSIDNKHYVVINNKIKNNYELPELVKEKEDLIKRINNELNIRNIT